MMFGISAFALATSFGAGIVSFLSPCVLPLVPGYVSYIGGRSLDQGQTLTGSKRFSALQLSLLFVLGFSTVFVILGASATALGHMLLTHKSEANVAAGAVIIVFGLLTVGLVQWSWLQRDLRFHPDLPGARPISAYVLGLAFALGWTPCIGPVLGTILTTSAASATVGQGIVMLSFYSVGLGLPFLVAALLTARMLRSLSAFRHFGRLLQIGAGGVMVLMGLAMITGQLSTFSFWLIETFPALAKVG